MFCILLLNRNHVILEVLTLFKYEIARLAMVDLNQISISFDIVDDKLFPKWEICYLEEENLGALEKHYRNDLENRLRNLWLDRIKPMLNDRLMGINEVRYE